VENNFIERAKSSCALGGAIATITSLPRGVPIVHASGGCSQTLSATYNLGSGYKGPGYCSGTMTPTSNVIEDNIVFGGEDRLEEQIEHTLKIMDGDLYFVVTGCQVEIIGDNAAEVTSRFKNHPLPVLYASTPGFLGDGFKGYEAVLTSLVKDFITPTTKKDKRTVNLLGLMPGQDVFQLGNLRNLVTLLAKLGLKANTFFSDGESIEKIKDYGQASLNLVFSEIHGVPTAEAFLEAHDIPFATLDLPIGDTGTEEFIRRLAKPLRLPKAKVEEVIESERAHYYSYFQRFLEIYGDIDLQRYAIVSADINYAYPLIRFVSEDLGWIPHLVVVNEAPEDEAVLRKFQSKFDRLTSQSPPKLVFEANTGQLSRHITESWPSNHNDKYYDQLGPLFILGSSLEGTAAQKAGAAILPVSYPVTNRAVLTRGYTCYGGGLTLAEDIFSALVANR
jgi:nitrogenase molybdenum-iron protein beta chain